MNVLITGASGLIGIRLKLLLQQHHYNIKTLTTQKKKVGKTKDEEIFFWQPEKGIIDEACLENTDAIIHLAGAGIADKKWTEKRKEEIVKSRVMSAELLFKQLRNRNHQVKKFISASAIGIYGNANDGWLDESSKSAHDFLGSTCIAWENVAEKFSQISITPTMIRTGIVLSKDGGALPAIATPVKLFAATPIGHGNQFMSWIHLNDLCNIYMYVLQNQNMNGAYNAVADHPVNNKEFMQTLANVLKKPYWNIPVPAFILKAIFGEKAQLVLDSQRVSNKKIKEAGFKFSYTELLPALQNIYEKK